jgi:hypothetical protein
MIEQYRIVDELTLEEFPSICTLDYVKEELIKHKKIFPKSRIQKREMTEWKDVQ